MKLKYITLAVVLAAATIGGHNLFAQQANTVYFMEGVSGRNIYNPAFQAPYDFYLDLPVMSNLRISGVNNSLTLNDIFFHKEINGRDSTITFLHPDAGSKRQDFFNALHKSNRTYFNATLDILGFGFRVNRHYFTFDVSVKADVNAFMPKEFFNILLNGTGTSGSFDLHTLSVDASAYVEAALGYSLKVNDKLTVGGKLKYLVGIANVNLKLNSLNLSTSLNKWVLTGDGTFNASSPGLTPQALFIDDPSDPSKQLLDFGAIGDAFDSNNFLSELPNSLSNFGLGVDLGATYQLLPALQLSAAVTDVGFIRWSNNNVNVSATEEYTFDGTEYKLGETSSDIFDKIGEEFEEFSNIFTNDNPRGADGKGYTTLLSTRLNVGVEYSILNNKIAFGVLSSTLFINKTLFPELTASVNFRPCRWVQPSVSYSILDSKFSSIGAGLQFKLGAVNVYVALDKIPIGNNSLASMGGIPIPTRLTSTNLHTGLTVVIGDKRKKKYKDDDHDGVLNYMDRCPNTPKDVMVNEFGCEIDSDGDGVADYLDQCPNTPAEAFATIEVNGCPRDSDGDGVPDYLDKCPNTPVEAYAAIDTAGCSKDSDGDGVPDYLDKCPNTPVEAYATIDTAGCSKDSDGDGVPDYLDKCPNTPVEAFAAIDTAGCVKDSDGDGVPDFLDRCPNTPAEAIGAVNSDGCVKDSDGDGVPDFLDKCPNTPKTEFANIDTAGCPKAKPIVVAEPEPEPVAAPILKQEEKKVFERAMHGIQFASGKDVINPTSYPILDAIVLIMEENPTYFLTIHGHTDNVGKPESNRVLSEKRAKAVKNYLIDKGVEFVRVSTQGFGDSKPLVSNNTKANQAKNRRVEFIIRYEKMVEIE